MLAPVDTACMHLLILKGGRMQEPGLAGSALSVERHFSKLSSLIAMHGRGHCLQPWSATTLHLPRVGPTVCRVLKQPDRGACTICSMWGPRFTRPHGPQKWVPKSNDGKKGGRIQTAAYQ